MCIRDSFFTSANDVHLVTRLPFAIDVEAGVVKALRAHMNANNPQASQIDGASVLISFSGPDSYVSPNWRTSSDRGATWDYTAVNVWGRCRVKRERPFFEKLITDLARANESKVADIVDKPQWSLDSVTADYVDRLFPALVSFEVQIDEIKGISKLHQDFPEADAIGVSDNLDKVGTEDATAIAIAIRNRRI